MQKIFFLLILGFSSLAQAQDPLCYQQEKNPSTHQVFQSEDEYNSVREAWAQRNPGTGNPFSLIKAYKIYKNEKSKAERMGTDKLAH